MWFQLGLRHDEAAQTALDAGLNVVQDRCLKDRARPYSRANFTSEGSTPASSLASGVARSSRTTPRRCMSGSRWGQVAAATCPTPYSCLRRLRSPSRRWRLRTRMAPGVTSTSSSSAIHSMAVSKVRRRGRGGLTDSSWLWVRMLVSSFILVGLTCISWFASFADNHPLVRVFAGADHQLAALLEVLERVGG